MCCIVLAQRLAQMTRSVPKLNAKAVPGSLLMVGCQMRQLDMDSLY